MKTVHEKGVMDLNAATQTALQNVFNKIKDTPTFHPANVNLFARHDGWTRQAGDVIRIKSDDTNYDLPITNLSLHWTGSSRDGGGETTKIAIEAAGNPEREPLPELKRKNYDTVAQIGRVRRYAAATQEQLEEDEQHYTTEFTKTNREISLTAKISGVKLQDGKIVWQQKKNEQGQPLYYDDDGNETTVDTGRPVYTDTPEWDDANGADVWGRLNVTGVMSQLMNAIYSKAGETIAIGTVKTSPGNVLIQAMNNRGTGTAKIDADKVNISVGGTGISMTNGNITINAADQAGDIAGAINNSSGTGLITLNAGHIKIGGTNSTINLGEVVYQNSYGYSEVNAYRVNCTTAEATNVYANFIQAPASSGEGEGGGQLWITANNVQSKGFVYEKSGGGSSDLKNAFVSVTDGDYVNNSKTVTFTKADGNTETITFSRATTLTGAVDGSAHTLTVTATPQGNKLENLITMIGHWGRANTAGEVKTTYYGTINATPKGGTTQAVRTFTVDALDKFETVSVSTPTNQRLIYTPSTPTVMTPIGSPISGTRQGGKYADPLYYWNAHDEKYEKLDIDLYYGGSSFSGYAAGTPDWYMPWDGTTTSVCDVGASTTYYQLKN